MQQEIDNARVVLEKFSVLRASLQETIRTTDITIENANNLLFSQYLKLSKEEFEKKISELFYEIDSDHNGNISKEEMQKQLMKLGLNSNFVKEECQRIFQEADTNNDQQIDLNEFSNFANIIFQNKKKTST